jgi:hypothetical protein
MHPDCDCLNFCDCHLVVAEMRAEDTANDEPQEPSSASPEANA